MKTQVTIDDKLLSDARKASKIRDTDELIDEALRGYVRHMEVVAAIERLGGSVPDAELIERP